MAYQAWQELIAKEWRKKDWLVRGKERRFQSPHHRFPAKLVETNSLHNPQLVLA
jgi:hypothetical protein